MRGGGYFYWFREVSGSSSFSFIHDRGNNDRMESKYPSAEFNYILFYYSQIINILINRRNFMRILHLTHNDADAVGCDVLLKLIYHLSYPNRKDIDIISLFCSNKNIDEVANFTLDNSEKFDLIYVTDNCVTSETAKRLEESCSEIHLYDHHPTNKLPEEFDWAIVQARENSEDPNSRMISAAEVLYNEIQFDEIYNFRSEDCGTPYHFLKTFMMDVSRYDTWEWKRHNKYLGLIPDLDPDNFNWFLNKDNYDILVPEPRNNENAYTIDPYYEDILEGYVTGGAGTVNDGVRGYIGTYYDLRDVFFKEEIEDTTGQS